MRNEFKDKDELGWIHVTVMVICLFLVVVGVYSVLAG